jgi:GT2 family glycosyltransferase
MNNNQPVANVGAVIVTYRTTSDTLRACLQGLKTNHIKDIVIVDNENSFSIKNITQKKDIKYLPQSKNLGFATAANIGASKLTNKYLLFINPDATLSAHSCANVEKYLDAHPSTGIVGFLLRASSGQIQQHSFGPIVTPFSLFTRHLFQAKPKGEGPIRVGWVSGGAMMIRHDLFAQLKGFDSNFFLYWEDVDLCRRATQKGLYTVLLPSATATHSRGASLSDNKVKTMIYDKSAGKYFCKHYSKTICFFQKFCRYLYRFISPWVD